MFLKNNDESKTTLIVNNDLLNINLINTDNLLKDLYKDRQIIEQELNLKILNRNNEESIYNNNIKIINDYITNIQNEITNFINDINIKNEEINSSITLQNMDKIINFAQVLNNKYVVKSSIFNYMNFSGTNVQIDYNNLINKNKKLLDNIELMIESEKPLEFKLKKINENIKLINKKIDLIKKFNIELSQIS